MTPTADELTPELRRRLRPLLLMLSAPTDGERLNAMAAIIRVLAAARCDWHDLVAMLTGIPRDEPPRFEDQLKKQSDGRYEIDADDLVVALKTIERDGKVDGKAVSFLETLHERAEQYDSIMLSIKQVSWLIGLLAKTQLNKED